MRSLFSTVTKKMIAGYLVILVFNLSAIGFALTRLHQQTRDTEQLVNVEFRLFELVRDLQQNLLAQENIEKQLLILQDSTLSDLRLNRNEEFTRLALALSRPPVSPPVKVLIELVDSYRLAENTLSDALFWENWTQAKDISNEKTTPLRIEILKYLAEFRQKKQQEINTGLGLLSARTNDAFQMTALLTLIGICLSAPVSLTVMFSIHRSVKALKDATQKISAGSFDHRPELTGGDEFSQLANDFRMMGEKLQELEQLRLDANPLTQLPGNLAIDREVNRRITSKEPFSHLYIDLDNFKAYSDRYGYKAGSDVLAMVGQLLREVAAESGTENDLVGHIGGDDYVILTDLDSAEVLAEAIVKKFDETIPSYYNAQDREAKLFEGKDRYGVKRTFPLMTISIAVIPSTHYEYPSRLAISQDCARLKAYLKLQEGSNYMLEKRKQ